MKLHSIEDTKLIEFKSFSGSEAFLTSYNSDSAEIPFSVKRVFAINVLKACKRGEHAHKECNQLLVSISGRCKVMVTDGLAEKEFLLKAPNSGLLVPSTLWANQEYSSNSILIVFTDQPYEESDYIRDYAEFLKFRNV
jgi:hypothetical protein